MKLLFIAKFISVDMIGEEGYKSRSHLSMRKVVLVIYVTLHCSSVPFVFIEGTHVFFFQHSNVGANLAGSAV